MKNRLFAMLMISAVAVGAIAAGDVLQQLGISKRDAAANVVSSLGHGWVDISPARNAMKAATPEARAAIVEQVLAWTKSYISSPEFAKDYASLRERQKPKGSAETSSVDDELKARRAKRAADMEASKKSIAAMPAQYRKQAEEAFKQSSEAMKKLDSPEFQAQERQMIEAERAGRKRDLDERLARWSSEYPADPKLLVRKRLQEFLKETAGVDFSAKLVTQYGSQRFANPDYESKGSDWKLAYRAGRPATERARAFAEQWLKELK